MRPSSSPAEKALAYARELGVERLASQLYPFLATARLIGPTPISDLLSWIDAQEAAGTRHSAFSPPSAGPAMIGRVDEAREIQAAAFHRATELGSALRSAICCSFGSEVERRAGDAAASERWAREACRRMEEMGHRAWLSTYAGLLGVCLCAPRALRRGRRAGGEEQVARARPTTSLRRRSGGRRGHRPGARRRGRGRRASAAGGRALARSHRRRRCSRPTCDRAVAGARPRRPAA